MIHQSDLRVDLMNFKATILCHIFFISKTALRVMYNIRFRIVVCSLLYYYIFEIHNSKMIHYKFFWVTTSDQCLPFWKQKCYYWIELMRLCCYIISNIVVFYWIYAALFAKTIWMEGSSQHSFLFNISQVNTIKNVKSCRMIQNLEWNHEHLRRIS